MPIKHVATNELNLPTHTIDTFTGWTPPAHISLVIAVSFGLFVPPRILTHAQYGGINVHPSLLPHLRGPAPIEHALLKAHTHTGVTIQTLHPSHFDHGTILAQTPPPGVSIAHRPSAHDLQDRLGTLGANMLIQVLTERRYLPPLQDVGWAAHLVTHKETDPELDQRQSPVFDHAPKLTKKDSFVNFSTTTLPHLLNIHAALGQSWCILPDGERLLIHKIASLGPNTQREPGLYLYPRDFPSTLASGAISSSHDEGVRSGHKVKQGDLVYFTTADQQSGVILESTLAGGKRGKGNAKVLRLLCAERER